MINLGFKASNCERGYQQRQYAGSDSNLDTWGNDRGRRGRKAVKSLLEQNHISPSRRWCHKRLASNKVPAFSSEGWGHKGEKRRARKIQKGNRQIKGGNKRQTGKKGKEEQEKERKREKEERRGKREGRKQGCA